MPSPNQTETSRIADQLRRAFAGGAWHGPSLLEILYMLHGIVQHELYHAGQIVLLKKALP